MSNEYLKRTPTSAGNRKIFTYAGWFKKSYGNGSTRFDIFNAYNTGSQQEEIGFRADALRYLSSGSSLYGFDTTNNYRDTGSWFHVVFALNTTLESERKRSVVYINGVEVDTTTSGGIGAYVAKNFNSIAFNVVGKEHNVLARKYSSSGRDYPEGGGFDIFFVDGQALTPDVFGFFKDGKGYQSSGTTKVTDFRPGQWSPHSPRKIKSEIERRGGFGVNGFYLPMNDSSNFGADFHCTPNSIIKLKGEDLPQPRNGLPTTSDNYVSELRPETGTLGFDGAVKFDGTDDYISIGDSSDWDIGTAAFTLEGWVLIHSNSVSYSGIFGMHTGNTQFQFRINNVGRIQFLQDFGGTRGNVNDNDTSGHDLRDNKFHHVAMVRKSDNSWQLYVDGYLNYSGTGMTGNITGINEVALGRRVDTNSYYLNGFISNFRFVSGTAVYTSNFTPPTEPLTAITNTKLLCCNSSTSATASTVTPATITANGGAFATRNELTGSIVLAVPGVNTQPTGSELVTNGTFDTNVSGWTVTDTGTIVRQSDGTAKVTRGSSAEVVYQDITTVVGTTYEVSVDITDIGGSHGQVYVKSTPHSGSLNTNIGYSFYPGTYKGTFTADTTTTRIYLYAHPSGYSSYDNVSVKATTIPDYHADIKGSGTNKTITPFADASVRNPHQRNGRHVNGYYGSALSLDGTGDALMAASHADFNLGNGDYTIEGWYYDQETAINSGNRCYWAIGGVNSEGTLALFRESSYFMLRGRSPGAGAYSNIIYVSNHNIPVGQWNHICTERFNGVTTVYINGVPLYPTEETTTVSQGYFTIGAFSSSGSYPWYGYIQDVRVYKGIAKYKGGFDVSKPYAPENSDTNKGIQTWRQVSDTCKNNFCTLNGLDTSQITPFNGSSSVDQSSGGWHSVLGTHYARSGKWYAEMRIDRLGWIFFGVEQTWLETRTRHIGGQTGSKGAGLVYNTGNRGDITYNGTNNAYTGGDATAANGDIISIALDLDNNNVKFYKNNVLQYNLNNILESGADYTFGLGLYSDVAATINFGQNPTFSGKIRAGTNTDDSGKGVFKYAPPSGFLALCDDNLPTPTIADPGKQFKAVTYTADDSSSMKISGVGFKPDLIWFKKRTPGSQNHTLFDSIRGVRRRLYPNTSDGEGTVTGYLSSFDENGFSIGGNNFVNDNGQDYVAWCWKAGGAAVANTDGSINSSVSANQTAGFSIVSYTGTGSAGTVGHGLGKRPSFILLKERYSPGNSYSSWQVYHSSLGATQRLQLNVSDAADTASNIWNDTEPTSDVFSIGSSGAMSENGGTYIAYCWAEIEGFSKFGKYIGNGNSDGPFVYLGFKPAWVLIKRTTTDGYYWTLFDNARKPTNPVNHTLNPDQVNAEVTDGGNGQIDFLSNGFKCRNTDGGINSDDVTYIYMAFAESPFQTANAK